MLLFVLYVNNIMDYKYIYIYIYRSIYIYTYIYYALLGDVIDEYTIIYT